MPWVAFFFALWTTSHNPVSSRSATRSNSLCKDLKGAPNLLSNEAQTWPAGTLFFVHNNEAYPNLLPVDQDCDHSSSPPYIVFFASALPTSSGVRTSLLFFVESIDSAEFYCLITVMFDGDRCHALKGVVCFPLMPSKHGRSRQRRNFVLSQCFSFGDYVMRLRCRKDSVWYGSQS